MITIYHNGEVENTSKYEAFAKGNNIEILLKDIREESLTGTRLMQLANKLNISVNDLMDKNSELYHKTMSNTNYDEADLLKVLVEHPELIRTPIAETEDQQVTILENPRELLNLKSIDQNIDAYNHKNNTPK